MGRSEDLYITIPSFFRCPISLDVMKSPVSLCTGVTYDRASIQRWLDGGNNTCPATMQVLHSKDVVPNLTLQRLIQIWFNSAQTRSRQEIHHLLKAEIPTQKNPQAHFECFLKILCFTSESSENRRFLAFDYEFLELMVEKMCSNLSDNFDLVEVILKILQLIVNCYEDKPKLQSIFLRSIGTEEGPIHIMTQILKRRRPESQAAVACIVGAITTDPESKMKIVEKEENLIPIMLQSTESTTDPNVINPILSALTALSSPRRNKVKIVRAGGVRVLGRLLCRGDYNTGETALNLIERLSGCVEGRIAIGEDPNCVPRIVQRILKVSSQGKEHGMMVLWSMCYLFRDQRARDAVARSNGVAKILVLMQSDCSPAVKQMCGDLLRVFKVGSKNWLSSYDSNTIHIMPC